MTRQIRNLEAEITSMIALNRSNCDFICHALLENGMDEELDVAPLRKHLDSISLGEGFGEFLASVDSLMQCEPKLDKTKVNPMLLEAWNCVYDIAKKKLKVAKLMAANLGDKPEKEQIAKAEAQVRLEEDRVSVAMVGFAQFRAQMHLDLGNLSAAKSVGEAREAKAGSNYKTFLVQRGKKVQDGMKPGAGDVWQAVKEKDVGRVQQLLENDFIPDEYDMTHGGTPLHQAAWDGEPDICRALLQFKANPNAQTLRGFTPLHFAMQHGYEDIVTILTRAGADVKMCSSMGQRPGGKGMGLGSEFEITNPFY